MPISRLKTAVGAMTAVGLLTTAFVTNWEGIRLYAYRDVIGVWTACQGITKDIKPGMKFTRSQCDALFIDELAKHEAGMRACLNDPDSIPVKPYVAMVSVTFNIGTGGFCRSSMARLINAGDLRGACETLSLYVKAGGRTIQGLVNRRAAERRLCMEGLDNA